MRISSYRSAITRTMAVIVVVIVVVVAGIIGGISLYTPTSTSSSTTPSTLSSTTGPSTLTIDEWHWPPQQLNQLNSFLEGPWPGWLMIDVYQPLIFLNETLQYATGQVQFLPGLAANWTVSPDGSTYTLNLRQDVHFSNGDPFNAYEVWMQMYAFYYLSDNSSAFLQSYSMFNMNTANFGPATIALINESSLINPSQPALTIMQDSSWPIYVTGPYQIVFRLKAPFAWFLGLLTEYDGLIFDTQYVLDHGGFGTPAQYNLAFNLNPIPGSGPYEVTAVSENEYVKFQQDPNYWGNSLTPTEIVEEPLFDPGHVKTVVIDYKADDVARYTDLSTGVAQIAAIGAGDWSAITSNPSKYAYTVLTPASLILTFMSLNTQIYPTNITAVRQAIVHAINYTDIVDKAFHGEANPQVGPGQPAYKAYYDLGGYSPYSFNLTLAEQYLKEANIAKFPTLTFEILSGVSYDSTIAQIVQSDLAKLNITVNILTVAGSQFYSYLGSYTSNVQNKEQIPQMEVENGVSWAPSAITPADNWVNFVSNQSSWGNTAIYYNPIVQACVNGFTNGTPNSTLIQLCAAAQKQVYDDAPYAWLGVNLLWGSDGSLVWQKGVINSFYLDPVWGGEDTAPVFNTVTFG